MGTLSTPLIEILTNRSVPAGTEAVKDGRLCSTNSKHLKLTRLIKVHQRVHSHLCVVLDNRPLLYFSLVS